MVVLVAAALFAFTPLCRADGQKLGFTVNVEGDGFALNPVVTRIMITDVIKGSLADQAGIVKGDEIVQIESQTVKGKRALELQPYMKFNAGETRTLRLKHANGELFDAKLTKPRE